MPIPSHPADNPSSPSGNARTGNGRLRHLVVVLGDQLDADSAAFDGFDAQQDHVFMAEVREESTHVPSSLPRIALFLAAMRHFHHDLQARGWHTHYLALDTPGNPQALDLALAEVLQRERPARVVLVQPGEWRVQQALKQVAQACGVPLDLRPDRHFLCSTDDFARHATGRKQLRMEFFYREMRRAHRVLMDGDGPIGGQWNFDAYNRAAFGPQGPGLLPAPAFFPPDDLTHEVLALVRRSFPTHAGGLDHFAWPVTRSQALMALERFISERLPSFGHYQDALWPAEPWLWHSHLSAALNLKLLDPREVIAAATQAYHAGLAPLASVEGFVRQILGWREYVRGIYWREMPGYVEHNALAATEPLPGWYWTGDTPMRCLADAIRQTLTHGYAHHIQRLMVTGLYALLLGVRPQEVHAWYLAVYVDAVEWVELPNTLGMSQAADGGLLASKPYVASGKYIERMASGSYCAQCRFSPAIRTGETACPFTTLYWDFLLTHEARLAANPRTVMQVRNLARLGDDERQAIRLRATAIRAGQIA